MNGKGWGGRWESKLRRKEPGKVYSVLRRPQHEQHILSTSKSTRARSSERILRMSLTTALRAKVLRSQPPKIRKSLLYQDLLAP